MNCMNCPFRVKQFCTSPKNYNPKVRQYHQVKLLTRRFFPLPPKWCKYGN
jgi:hypothetical protein